MKPPETPEKDFQETRCFFCEDADDKALFPARLYADSFTGYTFSARRERRREHYRIVKCRRCSLVRSDPVLSREKIDALYADSRFIYSDEAPYAARTYAALLAGLIGRHSLKAESLLDIGCGTGFFLERALEMGIGVVTGFEPSRECVERAAAGVKGKIIAGVFDPAALGGAKFDVACVFQVIDHLRDPKAALEAVSEVLNPGGHALIVSHDVESWTTKILGESSPVFDVEHVYLFSRKTMAMLVESAGLEAVEAGPLSNTYPLGYWMRMLPAANRLVKALPGFLRKIPIPLRAGNQYVLARKVN